MRIMIAGLMAWLVIATAVSAAEKPWDFVVSPPEQVQPLPLGANPRSVSLARVLIEMPAGENWATYELDAFARTRGTLSWESGNSEADTKQFGREFSEVLSSAAFAVAPQRQLFNSAVESDLQVGAIISKIAGRFCGGCSRISTPRDDFKGAASMSVEWQVYSPLDRKVVATIRTSANYEVAVEKRGVAHILNAAFRENARKLLNAQEFRELVLGGPSAPITTTQATPIHLPRVAAVQRSIPDATKSVVSVFANSGMGSGFLVSSDGYVLTNQHVVGDSRFVKLRWPDGTEVLGEVVRVDRRRDIALIKASTINPRPLALRTTPPQVGEAVYAVGTPLDAKFQGSVTKGIVSATRTYDGLPFIQSDAVINSGNSGGPLLDEDGAVIGVCVSGIDINGAPAGINLFIPIDDALKALALTPAA